MGLGSVAQRPWPHLAEPRTLNAAILRTSEQHYSRSARILRGSGSSEVFRVSGKEREEVAGDVPEDADDVAGRQGCFRVVEFGRERHPSCRAMAMLAGYPSATG